jgi:hypothetical protein
MAKKKPVRKSSPKPLPKKASKKNSVAMKSKPASSSKSSGTAKKGKVGKASSKPKRKGRASLKKAAVSQKKTAAKKPSAQKSVVTKKKSSSVSKKKEGSAKTKKAVTQFPSRSASPTTRSASPKTRRESLSPTERYNLGGLFVCAIERANDPEFKRLRAVLRHLELPSHEKDNLLRLSQGFTIPKLFADGIEGHKVSQTLADVIKFASAEGAYEKKWRDEIRQVGLWLGFFPQQVEQIEQKVLAKR